MNKVVAKPPETVEPVLSTSDRQSGLWLKLVKHMEARMTVLRAQNDGDHDERKTALLRGRIAELKGLIALAEDLPDTN